jgi:hypothetical protein
MSGANEALRRERARGAVTFGPSDLLAVGAAIAVWLLVWKLRFAPTLEEIRRRERRPRAFHVRDRRPAWKSRLDRAAATLLELAPDRHSGAFLLMPVLLAVFLLARLVGCAWAG